MLIAGTRTATSAYRRVAVGLGVAVVLAAIVWAALSAAGSPDPAAGHLSPVAVVVDTGILVFREGLEMILVLSAVTASMVGRNAAQRRPVAAGGALGFALTIATWFLVVAVLDHVNAPELQVQAATGLLAVIVLLVVMNWFFHKVYWTAWIQHHNRRRRRLLELPGDAHQRLLLGLGLLGVASVYREGFEVVLFLQTLRLQAGVRVVLIGALIGLLLTGIVGLLTFLAHRHLPYRRMLVLTGLLLAGVLLVMVGEQVQEMQLAGWMTTTALPLPVPAWVGTWLSVFPTVETLAGQALAGILVIGSYFGAEYVRVRRPRRLGHEPDRRPDAPPAQVGRQLG